MLRTVRLPLYPIYTYTRLNYFAPTTRPFRKYSTQNNEKNKVNIEVPRLQVKWFYATDVPNSKPSWSNYTRDKEPQKFIPFSDYDSNRLERRFQKLDTSQDSSAEKKNNPDSEESLLVEVNEDKLFQVDLKRFDLSPVYWEGPIYEVRRGTWFTSDGIPLPSDIARSIETGYRYRKPYNFGLEDKNKDRIAKSKNEVAKFNQEMKESKRSDMAVEVDFEQEKDTISLENGKVVLYCNKNEAVIFPSSIDNQFQIGVIRKFGTTPGSLISVDKIQRGYSSDLNETIFDNITSNPIPGLGDIFHSEVSQIFNLENDKDKPNNDTKQMEHEKEMKTILEEDFEHDTTPLSSEREVDHLVLCVHGIGQILGQKYESVNFVHSINVLRNTMKYVYQNDKGYQKLAYPDASDLNDENITSNNRVQILPISWRHKIDFHPKQAFKSYDENGNPRLPTLSQINVDGVKSLRNILGDVVLDVLLYYEPRYINQIITVVTEEINRVYSLYKERNPNFNGKVHIMGHSLGSVISFDILSSQLNEMSKDPDTTKELLFDVENLFCVGSPVGAFKLLGQTNIKPRSLLPEKFKPANELDFASPKCVNLYNIFHPCDPVGYRMEPLVNPKFSNFKPELVPFAVKGLNTQIKGLADLGEELQHRIVKASNWFSRGDKAKKEESEVPKSVEQTASEENALDDIILSLAKSDKKDDTNKRIKNLDLDKDDLHLLTEANKNGRVDYSLPMGVFDFSILSAISAHVTYFEDKDTAGFLLRELLASNTATVKTKVVSLYK